MTKGPLAGAAAVAAVLGLLSGCAGSVDQAGVPDSGPAAVQSTAPTISRPAAVPPVRQGRPARSERVEFVPERLTLPGRATAAVHPAETVDGVLKVPEDVQHVGWWDGSASAGEAFGSTVIAGHVDSAAQGIGFFARLLKIEIGDVITVDGGSHRLRYRVTSVQTVAKQALAADSQAFEQTGDHRLVLITCTGTFRRELRSYSSNLVVLAKPLGLAR